MGKRTSQTGLPDWDDAPDLDCLVQDKRKGKRANPTKGRRRNRRYENRLLSAQLTELGAPDEQSQDAGETPAGESDAI